jgi:peptidoglycan/LPS O-acetylase OafA/YrhL
MGTKRYEALDGMRGLCALIVAVHHFDAALRTGHLFNHGWLSVDIFFVLSGFVIALMYERKLQSGFSFSSFMQARATRLIPTQTLGTLVGAVSVLALYLHGDMGGIKDFGPWSLIVATAFALVLIPIGWSPVASVFRYWREMFPINPPIWSLQGEWIINIMYARGLYRLKASGLVAAWFVAAAILCYLAAGGGNSWDGVIPGIIRAAIGFIAGVLVFRVHEMDWFRRLPALRPEILFAIWFFLCSVPRTAPQPIFESATTVLIAPALIALLVRGERPMAKPWLVLGGLSYPLYASHFAVVNLANLMASATGWRFGLWALIPMMAASLLLAWAIAQVAARIQTSIVTITSSSSMTKANRLDALGSSTPSSGA